MSRPVICCDKCFSMIAQRNTSASKIWLDLCEIQETCAIFGIAMEDNKEFQLLEHLGFITTTDIGDLIVIRVHGKKTGSLDSYFCAGKCSDE